MIEEALKAEAQDDMGGPSIINDTQVASYPKYSLEGWVKTALRTTERTKA